MKRTIPRTVHLPGGYVITVRRLNDASANEEMGAEVYAMWDVDDKIITLRSARSKQKLREDWCHELAHAMVDYYDWFIGKADK